MSEREMLERAAAAAQEPEPIERCECGYPMPCSKTVPIGFCRAPLRDFTRAAAALAPTAQGE